MLRLIMLIAATSFTITSHALEKKTEADPVSRATATFTAEAAQVKHMHDLKTHLGLTDEPVVFGKTRNFRTKSMDDVSNADSVDPITEKE